MAPRSLPLRAPAALPWEALLPALLLALFLGWSGTYYWGASAAAATVGHLVLVAAAAWGWRGWDPLRLGPHGRALLPLLWLAVLASNRASAVPRAGWVAVAVLPLLLALPSAVARCWRRPGGAALGSTGIALVAAALAIVSLLAWGIQGTERVAQPLGHLLLLATCLAILLPLALAAAAIGGPAASWLGGGAAGLAALVLLASRSAAGTAAALVGGALWLRGRQRLWLLPVVIAAALLLVPRFSGPRIDPSLLARWVYWRAALEGMVERPWLGWGPGSTPWTLALHLRPVPAAVPAGEVVGDLHSLPLQIGYELGLAGIVASLLLLLAFAVRRWREGAAEDPLPRAGLAGLAAGAVALLATPTLGTTAVWVTLAVAAGAALVPRSARSQVPGSYGTATQRELPGGAQASAEAARGALPAAEARAGAGWLFAAIAVILLLPLDAAHGLYDLARRAHRARPALAADRLRQAATLDPEHPLYAARLGWAPGGSAADRLRAHRRAAVAAPGVAALQLAAGVAARQAGESGHAELLRACALDPLDGMAPFLLGAGRPSSARAARLGARALLATPGLSAALFWERHPQVWVAARRQLWEWPGVDPGYVRVLIERTRELPRGGAVRPWQRRMDDRPATALSLIAFRRLPWPSTLAEVAVRPAALAAVSDLPAAAALPITAPVAFPKRCPAP